MSSLQSLPISRVRAGPVRFAALAVNLAALALLCFELARITWHVVLPDQPAPPIAVLVGTGDESSAKAIDASALFGQAVAQPDTAIAASASGLSLSGVVTAGRGSLALISVDGLPAEPFLIGQEIGKGRKLHTAAEDHVLIRHGAKIERLDLAGRDAADPQAAPIPGPAATSQLGSIEQIAPNRYALSRGLAEAQLRSPEFLRQAMMVPQPEGGFLVRDIVPGSLYEKLGLRTGDVIRSVNGSPVNNLEDAMQLYRRLGSAGQVLLEVSRGGKVETLEYTIR